MIKKIMAFALALTMVSQVAFAASMDLEYSYKTGYSTTQGANGWRYQTIKNGDYVDLDEVTSDNRWRDSQNTSVIVTSSYVHFHPSYPAVISWEADKSGLVRVSCSENVRKIYNTGCDAAVNIKKNGTEVLWSETILGTDTTGVAFEFDAEVSKGDKITFEVSVVSGSNTANTAMVPTISYVKASAFSVGGTAVKSAADLKSGDTVTCTVYNAEPVLENSVGYLALYDAQGMLRALSSPFALDYTSGEKEKTLSVDISVSADSFSGFTLTPLILTADSGRFYSEDLGCDLSLK